MGTLKAQEAVIVQGHVYDDRNGNNHFDTVEKGLRGIAVSNGDTIVLTDRRGAFALRMRPGESLFPILPSDRSLTSTSRVVNAGFFTWHPDAPAPKAGVNFALSRKKVAKQFRLNVIGDVQVGDSQELDYALRTLWPELLREEPGTVNLFLGDMVNDNLSLLPVLKTLMQQLPGPSWTLVGNHDRDVGTVSIGQTASYSAEFGAPVYAFNEGNVHFIVLNNVYGKGKRGYVGCLTEAQLRFVANDLQLLPHDKQLVLAMHIPLAQTQNVSALLQLLEQRGRVLALTGHLHRVERYFLKSKGVIVHELSAGATCGSWWVGEKDWEGIPAALMQCGTPRGYFVFHFGEKNYSFSFKGISMDASKQMNIGVAGIDSTMMHPLGEAYFTVYGASDSTEVRCRIDGGEWIGCSLANVLDPHVERIRRWNLADVYPTRYSRIDPFRNQPSKQIWKVSLPASCHSGVHLIEVDASDCWGFHATGCRSFAFPGTSN